MDIFLLVMIKQKELFLILSLFIKTIFLRLFLTIKKLTMMKIREQYFLFSKVLFNEDLKI